MSTAKPDFRDAAVAASQELLQVVPSQVKPADTGLSLCLRVAPEEVWNARTAAVVQTLLSFIWIPGLGLGGLLLDKATPSRDPGLFALAMVLLGGSLVVLVLLMLGFFSKVGGLRARVAQRRGSLLSVDQLSQATSAELENGLTYDVPKITPEDLVLLVAEPAAGRLLLEGASHRYVIFREDVVSVQFGRPNFVTYRIGDVQLKLALVSGHLGAQVLANFGLGRNQVGQLIQSVVATPADKV
jgi:hypothetical protein